VVVHSLTSVSLTVCSHFGLRVDKGVLVLVGHEQALPPLYEPSLLSLDTSHLPFPLCLCLCPFLHLRRHQDWILCLCGCRDLFPVYPGWHGCHLGWPGGCRGVDYKRGRPCHHVARPRGRGGGGGGRCCKGTSIHFLTSPLLSYSPPVHMYSPSSPLYHLQGLHPKPMTSIPTAQRLPRRRLT
jgi:hypothetical protein